jgi:glutamate N-acetyltransferase / amino-acid N-acetyltransferase
VHWPALVGDFPVLEQGLFSALQVLTNAGQANAATGNQGMQDARDSQEFLAEALGCKSQDILVMSTGVIGRRIKLDKLREAIPDLVASLGSGADDAMRTAVAITTTGKLLHFFMHIASTSSRLSQAYG